MVFIWYLYSRQAKSYENINIRIISKDIYINNLIIAPMHFHRINDQASHIKCKPKCEMPYKLNKTKLYNQSKYENRLEDLSSCIMINKR
jgi:hypothetical protein